MILVGKPKGKRPLGRPRRRLVYIKIDLREMEWIDLAQDREQWRALAKTVMNLRGSLKCWEVLEWLRNWRLLKKNSAP
jgi:hypothetical protein